MFNQIKIRVKMHEIAKFMFNLKRNYRSKPFGFGGNSKNVIFLFFMHFLPFSIDSEINSLQTMKVFDSSYPKLN